MLTSHQHAARVGPLCPSIGSEKANRRELIFFAVSHLGDLAQLSQQVSFVESAEVDHHVHNEELREIQNGCK